MKQKRRKIKRTMYMCQHCGHVQKVMLGNVNLLCCVCMKPNTLKEVKDDKLLTEGSRKN